MKQLTTLKDDFDKYLISQSFEEEPQGLYAPVNYIMNLGGKRLRPLLLMFSSKLFEEKVGNKALPAALAIELFHNFSLLHDDIMDEAPLRRGFQTVHVKYDTNTAILSGDVMMILAYRFLLKAGGDSARLIEIFNQAAIEVCEGQQYDMDFETRDDVQIEEYLKMIEMKTAALLSACFEIGALIGGASSSDASNLEKFGRNMGIAFQIQDDILDTFGDPEKFGKKVGGDIIQNKKTFLLLKTLELAKGEQLATIENWLATRDKDDEKVKFIAQVYKDLGVLNLAEKLKTDYMKKGLEHLAMVNCKPEKRKMLEGIADEIMHRRT